MNSTVRCVASGFPLLRLDLTEGKESSFVSPSHFFICITKIVKQIFFFAKKVLFKIWNIFFLIIYVYFFCVKRQKRRKTNVFPAQKTLFFVENIQYILIFRHFETFMRLFLSHINLFFWIFLVFSSLKYSFKISF